MTMSHKHVKYNILYLRTVTLLRLRILKLTKAKGLLFIGLLE